MTNFSPLVALLPFMLLLLPTNGQMVYRPAGEAYPPAAYPSYTYNPYQYDSFMMRFYDPAMAAAWFQSMDPNNDTSITLQAFMMNDTTYVQIYTALQAAFEQIDTNNDSVIEVSEQVAYVQKLLEQRREEQIQQLNMTMRMYERGDNKLEPNEFENYLENGLCKKPKENVTVLEVMVPFDLNHDNAINDTELYNFNHNIPEYLLESTCDWTTTSSTESTTISDFTPTISDSTPASTTPASNTE